MRNSCRWAAIALSSVLCSAAFADVAVLQSIEVSATRQTLRQDEVPSRTFVIDAQAAQSQPARDPYDLLDSLPNTTVRRYGGVGGEASITMYGQSGNPTVPSKTLVAVNGIPLNSGLVPDTSLNIFPLSFFSRIEVIQGPGSVAYGNNAMTGVVNFMPRVAQNGAEGLAEATAGRYDTFRVGGYLATGARNDHSVMLAFNDLVSDGHIQPYGLKNYSDAHTRNLAVQGEKRFGDTLISAAYLQYDYTRNNPSATLSGALSNEYEDGNRAHGHVSLQHALSAQWMLQFAVWRNEGERESFSRTTWTGATPAAGVNPASQKDTTDGVLVKANWETTANLLTFGYERQRSTLVNRLTGIENTGSIEGLFVMDHFLALERQLALSVGYRYDKSTAYPDADGSPAFGFVWSPLDTGFSLRGQRAKSFKAPTFAELYQTGRILGNPNLKAQTFWLNELGVDFAPSRTLSLSATVYKAELTDPIYWRPYANMPPGVQGRYVNVADKTTTDGATLVARWSPTPQWQVEASYDYLDPGLATFSTARHTVKLTPAYRSGDWSAWANLRHEADRYWDDNYASPAPDYTVLDAFLGMRIGKHFEIFGSVENLFGKEYATGASVSVVAGQRYWVGVPRAERLWTIGVRGQF